MWIGNGSREGSILSELLEALLWIDSGRGARRPRMDMGWGIWSSEGIGMRAGGERRRILRRLLRMVRGWASVRANATYACWMIPGMTWRCALKHAWGNRSWSSGRAGEGRLEGGGIKYHRISGCVYSYAWYVVWCAIRLGGDWMFILWFVWRWVLVSCRMLGRGRMSRDGRLECIEQKWLDERWDMVQDQKKLWQAVNWEVGLIRFIVSWLAIVCERHWGGSRKCLLIWWSVGGLLQHWPDECRAAYDARPDAREIYRSSKQTRSFS